MSYSIPCTGDCTVGDKIEFTEAVFGGSFRKPKFLGERVIRAEIVNDSYGQSKQQHTFTIIVIESFGFDPVPTGTKTTRKGRNIYRNGTLRKAWEDETKRRFSLDEKHARGDWAREQRAARMEQRL